MLRTLTRGRQLYNAGRLTGPALTSVMPVNTNDGISKRNFGTGLEIAVVSAVLGVPTTAAVGAALCWRTAKPNEMLVKTGMGIDDMSMHKKAFHWPFQRMSRIQLEPRTYHSTIDAMSKEKIAFIMPTVFTIGPKDDDNDPDALKRYALINRKNEIKFQQTE
jgi:hypothetical protein